MRIWTIQTKEAFDKFKETRTLRADEAFIYEDFKFHYDWMVEQMNKRIGPSPTPDIIYPIWSWYQWSGINRKRPDLRSSGHLPKGTNGVLIEFEVNPQEVLLSDFEDFNSVLNYGYISDTEVEYDAFYSELAALGYTHDDLLDKIKTSSILEQFKQKLYNSWEKIFDTKEPIIDESWSGRKETQSTQATLWEVKLEQVISVKEFIAR